MNIKLNNYEGPFDILLNLIKENEMDIYDIKIVEITKQYLDYIDEMKNIDLELTSEFIVMAAKLIEIKSKMLLPKTKTEKEIDEVDPRQELMEKLIEYKKFKHAAAFFKERESSVGIVYCKLPEVVEGKNDEIILTELLKNITLNDINIIYIQIMKRYINKLNTENIIQTEIPIEIFKIEDKMQELIKAINHDRKMNFSNYALTCTSKMEVVVSFLALLELIKVKFVKVYQSDNFSEIYIEGIE